MNRTCNSTTGADIPEWVKQVTNQLFALMKTRYEGTYHRTWEDDKKVKEAKRNWAEEIGTLDQIAVRNGIELLFDRYPNWPPNLNGFIQLCKERKPSQAMYQRDVLKLPKKPTDDDIKKGKSALADIRSKLR